MRDGIPVTKRWRRTQSLGYYSAAERRIERRGHQRSLQLKQPIVGWMSVTWFGRAPAVVTLANFMRG
jgi:hypothetical protein